MQLIDYKMAKTRNSREINSRTWTGKEDNGMIQLNLIIPVISEGIPSTAPAACLPTRVTLLVYASSWCTWFS